MPDDHYCCKICGQINCVCANQPTPRPRVAPPTLGEILTANATKGVVFKPKSFIHDFNEISVTWKFDTNQEAAAFAKAISDIGIT